MVELEAFGMEIKEHVARDNVIVLELAVKAATDDRLS